MRDVPVTYVFEKKKKHNTLRFLKFKLLIIITVFSTIY